MKHLISSIEAVPADNAYVSFSAGKDSAVLAHAANVVYPGIQIWMVDPGIPTHWTEEEQDKWLEYASSMRWSLRVFPWDKWAEVGEAASEKDHRKKAHDSMFEEMHKQAHEESRTHVLMGLRAQESHGRRFSLATHGEAHTSRSGTTRHCPLGLWTHDDIWAYTITHGLPWLTIYDHLGPEARNGLIGRSGVQQGRMAYLRRYFPDAYRHARDVLGLDYAQ